MFNGMVDLDNYGPYVSKIATAAKSNNNDVLAEGLIELTDFINRDAARCGISFTELAQSIIDNYPELKKLKALL